MNIRARLTITFFAIVIVVVSIISISIFYLSSNYRAQDFKRRLKNRAINAANLLTQFEEVDATLLQRMERENPANLPNQNIIIYNDKDEILYTSQDKSAIPIDSILINKIRVQNDVMFNHQNFECIGFLFEKKDYKFTVVAAATDLYGMDALNNLRDVLLITFSGSILLVSLIGWFYAGKVLSPISRIVKEVDNITEANLHQKLDEGNSKDELSKLAQTFNKVLGRLYAAFFSQKNFIANASHQIKTPITVMAGEIEVTLLQPRNNDYYVKVLRSVLQGIKGLNTLSTQLLLLAQTSADNPAKKFTPIRVDDILWESKEDLSKAHPEYNIDIVFDMILKHELLLIAGDHELLKVVVLNLMDNGCKYSDNNRVHVTLKFKHDIIIEFVNSGTGIHPDDIQKIFAPFYRGTSNKKVSGFGIGLSITKRIVELHQGKLLVASTLGGMTQFTLFLPVEG